METKLVQSQVDTGKGTGVIPTAYIYMYLPKKGGHFKVNYGPSGTSPCRASCKNVGGHFQMVL